MGTRKKKNRKKSTAFPQKKMVGWREWVALPELGLPAIEVKVDTGARTSALHAFSLEIFEVDGKLKARFGVHPLRNREDIEIYCEADVIDQREVSDSGGHRETRCVIQTPIEIGGIRWPIELTLTNRDTMKFRMLLGRTAMRYRLNVNPSVSYTLGHLSDEIYNPLPTSPTEERNLA